MRRISIILFVISLLAIHATASAQTNPPSFKVEGEVLHTLTLTAKDLAAYKSVQVRAKDRDEKEHTYTGVPLYELLKASGVTLGSQLRGENLAKYIRVQATDGYEVIFSLPEVDPEFSENTVLLAFEMDGASLPKGEGPFRIVAPADKKHARWIRQIATVKILFSKD